MRRIVFLGVAAAAVIAAACSDSAAAPKAPSSTAWSGAVIEVAAANPNAHGELRGVVLDSTSGVDPSKATPIPGATIVLNLKISVAPSAPGDSATTTVTKIGEVVSDANGRFLVTAIPEGDYYLQATPPANESFYSVATWAFVSSGSTQADALIYLPRKLGGPVIDTTPRGTDDSIPRDTIPHDTIPPVTPPPSDSSSDTLLTRIVPAHS